MIGVVAMDLSRGIGIVMGLLMYATPVMYAGNVNSDFVRIVAKWNPLTYLVCSCRDIVVYGRLYGPPAGYFICAGISFLLFLIAWRLFYVSEHRIIERMV